MLSVRVRQKLRLCGRRLEGSRPANTCLVTPSTGAVIAYAPQCTAEEVETIHAAESFRLERYPVANAPKCLFKMKAVAGRNLDELTNLCAQEHGKNGTKQPATCQTMRLWSLPAVPLR